MLLGESERCRRPIRWVVGSDLHAWSHRVSVFDN